MIDLKGLGLEEGSQDILIRQEAGHFLRYLIYQLNEETKDCRSLITSRQLRAITRVSLQNKDIPRVTQHDFLGLDKC